jgi:hypothetical protein
MPSPISSLVRQTEKTADRLSVLTFCFEEKHELLLANTKHDIVGLSVKDMLYRWNGEVMMKPENYTLLQVPQGEIGMAIPQQLNFDVVVGYERPGHYEPLGRGFSNQLQIPLVMINNQFPVAISDAFNVGTYANMAGEANIFGNTALMAFWNINGKCEVIHPGVNTQRFTPTLPFEKRSNCILTVGHNFMKKAEENSFSIWKTIMDGNDALLIGHNPGMSFPNKFMPHSMLSKVYQETKVYLNTTVGGIFPVEILEAMACGCVVVTLPFPGITEFIQDGETGFVCRDAVTAKRVIKQIINDKAKFEKISQAARAFIEEKCNLDTQSAKLDEVLRRVIEANKEKMYE